MSDPDLAHRWTGLRQDSGDPFAFGPRVKKMYQSLGIPNDSKSLIFSDSLTVNKCIDIKKQCDELNFNKGTWKKLTLPSLLLTILGSVLWHRYIPYQRFSNCFHRREEQGAQYRH